MKKLMFAAVAVLGLSAFAAIESSNIVGYQKIDNRKGNTLQVATFNAIGTTGYSLQDVIPVGEAVVGGGETAIQTLNANKTTSRMFFWLTDDEWGVDDGDGWYEDPNDTSEKATYVFEPGEGFIFNTANGEASVTYAGQVQYPVELAMRKGNTICGNFWPKAMSIQQIIPSGAAVVGGGETAIQTLNANKTTAKMFFWLTDDEWGVDDGDGWYEDPNDTSAKATYNFAAGEGYIFNSANGAATLSFPEL